VRPETLKLPKENIRENVQDTGTGKNFLDRIPKAQKIEAKRDKSDGIKGKCFSTEKETISTVQRQPIE
jgi:hypothetical protein